MVGHASATDPSTWGTFEQAIATCCLRTDLNGVGFVFTRNDPFLGVDLDHCIDPSTGQPKAWAATILKRLDSYSEISPSGTGIKIIVRASKPGPRCKKGYQDGAVEMYDCDRFFTVTGQSLHDPPKDVGARQKAIDALYADVFGALQIEGPAPTDPSNSDRFRLADDEILRLACASRKSGATFARLWEGRWQSDFRSQSEADASVVFTLAYYTKDAAQIDRLFRRSGLMRPKWDERHGRQTYGALTIAKALATVSRQYKPRKRRHATKSSGTSGGPLSGEPGTVDPVTGRLILSTKRNQTEVRACED